MRVSVLSGPESAIERSLLSLPLVSWAQHFASGTLVVRGRLPALSIPVDDGMVSIDGSHDATLEVQWTGGRAVEITQATLQADALTVQRGEESYIGEQLRVAAGWLRVGGYPDSNTTLHPGAFAERLVREMHHVHLHVVGRPLSDLWVQFGPGVQVHLARSAQIVARAATSGPTTEVCLAEPLELIFGHDGLQIRHGSLAMLSRIAQVRLSKAILHPDGSIALEGGAGSGFDVLAQGGLRKVSAVLSNWVRNNPRLARIRVFLPSL